MNELQANNTPNKEEQAVSTEIHNWARHINNVVWLVTSFFITLNFIVISKILSDSVRDCLYLLDGWETLLLLFIVFLSLWLVPASCVVSLLIISEKLHELLNRCVVQQKEDLEDELKFHFSDFKRFFMVIKEPWGWIIIAFTIFFGLIWTWIFYFIDC